MLPPALQGESKCVKNGCQCIVATIVPATVWKHVFSKTRFLLCPVGLVPSAAPIQCHREGQAFVNIPCHKKADSDPAGALLIQAFQFVVFQREDILGTGCVQQHMSQNPSIPTLRMIMTWLYTEFAKAHNTVFPHFSSQVFLNICSSCLHISVARPKTLSALCLWTSSLLDSCLLAPS